MANPILVVEDGTGLADANSYSSIPLYTEYWNNLGVEVTASQAELDGALIRGAQFLDLTYGPSLVGVRMTDTQALEFPRIGLYTASGLEITGIPTALRSALHEAASRALTQSLMPDPTTDASGLAVKRRRIDVLETEFFQSPAKSVASRFPPIHQLMVAYLTGGAGSKIFR